MSQTEQLKRAAQLRAYILACANDGGVWTASNFAGYEKILGLFDNDEGKAKNAVQYQLDQLARNGQIVKFGRSGNAITYKHPKHAVESTPPAAIQAQGAAQITAPVPTHAPRKILAPELQIEVVKKTGRLRISLRWNSY